MNNKETEIHVTGICSHNCLFCSVKKHPKPERSTKDLKKDIRLAKQFTKLTFSGGEPIFREDIIELISYARRFQKNICLETNATKLTKKLVSQMVKIGLKELKISFHSYNKQVYKKITNSKNSFDKVVNVFNILKDFKNKIKITTNTVITVYNKDELCGLVKYLLLNFPYVAEIRISYPRFYPIKGYRDYSKRYLVPLKDLKIQFKRLSSLSTNKIVIENVPLCVVNTKSAQITNLDKYIIYDGKITKGLEGRCYPSKCQKCLKKKDCQGTHRFYTLYFDTDFIKPFLN